MSDNVTPIGGGALPENPLQPAPRRDGFCDHDALIVDAHERTVRCANPKCGATIDPFGYLLHNARRIQQAWDMHKQVMRQVNEVNERVHALKKEEQRLRAMVKRQPSENNEPNDPKQKRRPPEDQ
jgi:hypothetical protein